MRAAIEIVGSSNLSDGLKWAAVRYDAPFLLCIRDRDQLESGSRKVDGDDLAQGHGPM